MYQVRVGNEIIKANIIQINVSDQEGFYERLNLLLSDVPSISKVIWTNIFDALSLAVEGRQIDSSVSKQGVVPPSPCKVLSDLSVLYFVINE